MSANLAIILLGAVAVLLVAFVPLARVRQAKRDCREMKRHLQSIGASTADNR